ncbi:MAG: aspartate carbamoyltransferase catalytic subunit [Candidatus Limnocylindria bacterium]
MRHLLDVDVLSRNEIERLLDVAVEMRAARAAREHRSLLEREVVALAFYEASTRTRVSFELAAKALGATVVDLGIPGSSVVKGESLVDTLRTLERTGVTTVVLRHPESGAPYLAVRTTGLRVVNAGDGTHAHPTQALSDALTLREALGRLDGRVVAIVGDVAHSRVARSNLHALVALGARVRVTGPAAWVRGFESWPGVSVAPSLEDAVEGADAVMTLRVQVERLAEAVSLADYTRAWRLDDARMRLAAPGAPILHPGPTNEGVEITAELANRERSLIGRQVENGVPVRMAVLATIAGAA